MQLVTLLQTFQISFLDIKLEIFIYNFVFYFKEQIKNAGNEKPTSHLTP
jgi:hypothetical protein